MAIFRREYTQQHWQKFVTRFCYGIRRKLLFVQLERVLDILKRANSPEIFLNGSFVTNISEPNDYDLCWEPTGVIATNELRELLQDPGKRKDKYLGDIFPRLPQPPYYYDHVERWQYDEDGIIKGIIRIEIGKAS